MSRHNTAIYCQHIEAGNNKTPCDKESNLFDTASSRPPLKRRTLLRVLFGVTASTAALVAFARNPLVTNPALQQSAAKRGDTQAAKSLRVRNSIKVLPTFEPNAKLTAPESGMIAGMTIERDERSGQIRRVRGEYVGKDASETPKDAARAFLASNARILGLSENLSELRLLREVESLTGTHVTYQQVYAGLPVIQGQLSVHLNKNNVVQLVNHDLKPITRSLRINTPQNAEKAIQAALAATGTLVPTTQPKTEAGVLVSGGTPRSVWRVRYVDNSQIADFDVMVDGDTLKVITVRNDNRHVDGTGKVYETNPVQFTGIANLTDNNNADSPTLTNARQTVTIRGLDGTGTLTGTYVRTAVAAGVPRANSPTFNFDYTRSQNQFDETMCYYHIDQIERYIQGLGFNNINNRRVVANVNTITDDNAFYSPGTKEVTFGSGGVDDAEDSLVIWHEMGHAIHDNQVPGWGSSQEGGSMGEGFGDYWGGSHDAEIGGPQSPAWDVFCGKWDAVSYNPGTPAFLRTLDSTKVYPNDVQGEVHADGEMWSASLWQIRGIVGRTRADKTVLESHFSVSPNASFADGANAYLAANQALYAGQDQSAIRQVFINRGFIQVHTTPTNLTASPISATQVNLTWSDSNPDETGFRIERKIGTGAFSEIAVVGANVLSYSDTGLTPNTDYAYRVRAYSGQGNSRYSNEALTTTPNQTYSIAGRVSGVAGIAGVNVTATGTASITSTYSVSPNLPIEDFQNGTPSETVSTLNVPATGTLTNIRVGVNISHTWIGDLTVEVIAPDGTTVLLHNREGGSTDDLVTTYPTPTPPAESLAVFNNKQVNGNWRLRVRDNAGADVGTFNSWSLRLTYTGTVTQTVATNASGDYAFTNLPSATYTVTPSSAVYTFSPANRSVIVGPDAAAQNFTANTTVAGTVSLQGVIDSAQPIEFTFRPTVGSAFTRNATLTASGAYSIPNIPAGTYTLSIKGAKWLRKNITVNSSAGNIANANATLLAGDANNDNFVDIADLNLLIPAYNQISPAAGYSAAADFNADGKNDIADLLLLVGNYNVQGDL